MESPPTAPEGLLRAQDKKLVRAGLRAPDLALATRELAHARVAVGERIGLECLGLGIEAEDGVRAPVADPDGVDLVDVDRVGLRAVARKVPARPALGLVVVAEEIAAIPAGDPKRALAVAPDTARALARHRRPQHAGSAQPAVDLGTIISRARGK